MNKQRTYFFVLAGLLVMVNTAWSQPYSVLPPPTPIVSEPAGAAPVLPPEAVKAAGLPPMIPHGPPVPSDWVLYRKCESCCGPFGGDGPIKTEFYLRSGWTFPIGGFAGNLLESGWIIQGGARMMVFNPTMDAAWALDISGSNAWNHARETDLRIPLSIIVPNPVGVPERVELGQGNLPGVTLRDLNRTFVNVALGKMWYLNGSANCGGWTWRAGIDAGGRYGAASAQFFEIRQRSDVIGGAFLGLHTDIEIPCGCCVFHGGIRTEYSYTWSDILQRPSDVEEINFLFSLGVRY